MKEIKQRFILSKLIRSLFITLAIFFISCQNNKTNNYDVTANLPLTVPLKPAAGYIINPFTRDSIKKLITSEGKLIASGIPLELSLKKIDLSKFKTPTAHSITEPQAIILKSNRIPAGFVSTLLDANQTSSFTLGTDTSSYQLKNSTGSVIKTNTLLKLVGRSKKCVQPIPTASLPKRMMENARYNIQYLDVEQGMSSSYISAVIQDKDKALWIASKTGGISYYNGRQFVHYSENDGLPSNNVSSLCRDANDNIWIGTDKGLCLFNGLNFLYFTEENGFLDNGVRCMVLDANKNLWIGTDHGLAKFDGAAFTFYSKREGLKNNHIRALAIDRSNNLWIGTDGDGIAYFNGKTFTSYTAASGLKNETIRSLAVSNDGLLWIGTKGSGPIKFDGIKFTSLPEKHLLSKSDVRSIVIDKDSSVLFALRGEGLIKYNKNSFEQYTDVHGLSTQFANCVLADETEGIWLGTDGGGLNYINTNGFKHIAQLHELTKTPVTSITESNAGAVYLAMSDSGLIKLVDTCIYYYTKANGLPTNNLGNLCGDKKGNLWCATGSRGILKIKGTTCFHYDQTSGLPEENLASCFVDAKDNIWFGFDDGSVAKFSDDGIYMLDLSMFGGNAIRSITEDKSGNIWFSINTVGVAKFDGTHVIVYSEAEGLSSGKVRSMLVSDHNDLWLCTDDEGVMKLNEKTITQYSEKEGLSHNTTWSIVKDKQGRILIGTELGLTLIDERQSSSNTNKEVFITTFAREEGLKGLDFYSSSALVDSRNRGWWYCGGSLSTIDLNSIRYSDKRPEVKMTQLDIDGNLVDFKNLSDSSKKDILFSGVEPFYNYPKNLVLPYFNNHLTFYFNSIDWKASSKIKYQYFLEGADLNWSSVTTNNHADYRNIAYGTYTFKVRCIGVSNNWSNTILYTFTIDRPWWHSWWFRSFMVLMLAFCVWTYIKLREKKLLQEKLKLEATVKERTLEIVEQKHQIEEKHKEITDSINYAERIQRSLLASKEMLDTNLKDHFVFFLPKDVVSGDFYWAGQLNNGNFALLTGDSTGHGVPGAIMSILNISCIEKAVESEKLSDPKEILNHTRSKIISTLKKDGSIEGGKDGMDCSLCVYDFNKLKLEVAAAHIPVWIVRDKELIELKADKMPVGKHDRDVVSFTKQVFQLQSGDVIYTLTDGYPDQFGGERGKKFMSKNLKELLVASAHLPMQSQKELLRKTFVDWVGKLEQVDDVTLIGVRV